MSSNFAKWLGMMSNNETGVRRIDQGLLLLRLCIGFMMLLGHGSDKLINFSEYAQNFPDPIGLGNTFALVMVIFAEFFCSLAIIFGLYTRLAVIPPSIIMLFGVFVVHTNDPWLNKELALLYLIPYLTLLLAGPGRYSLDRKIFTSRLNGYIR